MPQVFVVDQRATFQALAFLNSQPKMVFGSRDRQETAADGTPKWEVELVAGFLAFGRVSSEVIKVGFNSYKDPCEGFAMYTPVQLANFVVGVSPVEKRTDKDGKERITGGTAWYRADDIRPATAPPSPAAKQS